MGIYPTEIFMPLDTPGASGSRDLPVIQEETDDTAIATDSGNNEEPIVETAVTSDQPFGILNLTHTASP